MSDPVRRRRGAVHGTALATLLGLALCASHARPATAGGGIIGYLDPATGTFRTAPRLLAATPGTTAAVSKGTIVVSFTITIASTIATATPITCAVTANVYLAANPYSPITDSASTVATRNGATATCRVTVPFLWSGYGSTDMANLWYEITANDAAGHVRDSQLPLAIIKVPSTGTVTSFSVSANF